MRILRIPIPAEFTPDSFKNQLNAEMSENFSKQELTNSSYIIYFWIEREYHYPHFPYLKEEYISDDGNATNVTSRIEVVPSPPFLHTPVHLGVYNDFLKPNKPYSWIMTNQASLEVCASIYATQNDHGNCVMYSDKKHIASAIDANVYILTEQKQVLTPSDAFGRYKEVYLPVLSSVLTEHGYTLMEGECTAFDLQKAQEVFLLSVYGLTPVSHFKKQEYSTTFGEEVAGWMVENMKRHQPLFLS